VGQPVEVRVFSTAPSNTRFGGFFCVCKSLKSLIYRGFWQAALEISILPAAPNCTKNHTKMIGAEK
jgi:hypothetical protein